MNSMFEIVESLVGRIWYVQNRSAVLCPKWSILTSPSVCVTACVTACVSACVRRYPDVYMQSIATGERQMGCAQSTLTMDEARRNIVAPNLHGTADITLEGTYVLSPPRRVPSKKQATAHVLRTAHRTQHAVMACSAPRLSYLRAMPAMMMPGRRARGLGEGGVYHRSCARPAACSCE